MKLASSLSPRSPWLLALALVALCRAAVPPAPAQTSVPPALPEDRFLRDFAATRGFTLGRPTGAKPTPDGKAVVFLRARSAREPSQELWEFNAATGETRRLLTPEAALGGAAERLSPEEKARRERQRVTVGGFAGFELSRDGSFVLLGLSGKLYVLRRATGSVTELTHGEVAVLDPKLSPDCATVAYVRGADLYVTDLATHVEHAVTAGGTETVSHGLAEFVAQEEMGRSAGFWWSPDSRSLLFEEADASKVESWFVVDPSRPEQPAARSFYPRPGKNNVAVRLGIAPVGGKGKTVWLRWDRGRYPYLAKAVWGAAGPLTLVVQSRDQTELAVLEVDPVTGNTRTLLTERDPAWINLDHEMPRWLPENLGGGFLWTSEPPGAAGWQLERRNRDGSPRAVLVPPTAGFRGLAGIAGRDAYFRASPDPTQFGLFRVPLDGGGEPVALTTEPGQHRAEVGGSGVYVHQAQTPAAMNRTFVRRTADDAVIGELPSVAEEPPFAVRSEFVKTGAGEGFHAVVIRPRNFEPKPGQRLPVIVDVYGGPTANRVNRTLGGYLLDQWLADQGFLVVSMDGRGTPGRGRDWERAVGGRLGEVPLEDQAAALRALGERFPEMDATRVGITGWSFGGYLSALAVLRRPDVFKAAVAGAPVVDWEDYDTHYTERYLGVPPDDRRWPDAYRNASLLTWAGELRRPLLLVHGTADDNVFFRHSLRLTDALFRAGRPFELLPLAGLTHQVPDPAVREALSRRTAEFFRAHLREK